MVKVSFFTVLTVCAAAVLFGTPGAISTADLEEGFALHLPKAGLATAIAVFGITGVGATELVMYPYWCIEKGYARYTGPRDGTAAWLPRARGWIRVMHLDIACSLVIYTCATLAFYLLGAGVLHKAGLVPKAARHDRHAVAALHRDARRLGALAVLRRRRDHALRHDLRLDCGTRARDRGSGPDGGRLRAGRRRSSGPAGATSTP